MRKIVLRGFVTKKDTVQGRALVVQEPISFRGETDRRTGIITRKEHELKGESLSGKILVFPFGSGSVGSCYVLWTLGASGIGPKAIIVAKPDAPIVIGAMLGGISVVCQLDKNPLEAINTGDFVVIDGKRGVIKVQKQ